MNLACWYENANNIFEISPAVGIGTQEPAPLGRGTRLKLPNHQCTTNVPSRRASIASAASTMKSAHMKPCPIAYRLRAIGLPHARCPPPAPAYPGHYLVRHVSNAGTLRFQTHQLFMSDMLVEGDMALEEAADGIWSIDFSNVLVVRLDARDFRLYAGTRVIDGAGLHCHRCARLLQGRGSTVARSLS